MRVGSAVPDRRAIHHRLQRTPKGVQPSDMGQSLLQVDSYGGAVKRVSATETAMRQRSSIMKLQYQTYWINATRPLQWSERGAARRRAMPGAGAGPGRVCVPLASPVSFAIAL